MMYWAIFEADKLVTNMSDITFVPLKALDDNGNLKILKYDTEESAVRALQTKTNKAYKAKNINKDCSYLILKVYE